MSVPSNGINFVNWAIFRTLQQLFPFFFGMEAQKKLFLFWATTVLSLCVLMHTKCNGLAEALLFGLAQQTMTVH